MNTPAITTESAVVQVVLPPDAVVLLEVAEPLVGYKIKAMRRKIEDGVWIEGKEYHRAPDGRILVDLGGVYRWVRGKRA